MLTKLINHVNQRRELNRWLRKKRSQQRLATNFNAHMQRDLGIGQQYVETPLTWQEPKQEVREKTRRKERSGSRSA